MAERNKHEKFLSGYIKDIIYGANDGIITTFVVVAGVAGASLSTRVILILGFANLIADGISMAASNYLGAYSEAEVIKREELRERHEIKVAPREETEEIRQIFRSHGYDEKDTEELVGLVKKNEDFWLGLMMRYELNLMPASGGKIFAGAVATFFSFVIAGALPLLPYIALADGGTILVSGIATAVSLFVVGAARSLVTRVNWFISGLEMLLIGGIAAAVAYFIGYAVSFMV